MHRQEFEKHPKLAESLMLMAGTQTAMTLTEWNAFIENLCAALVDGDAALKAENERLREAFKKIISHPAFTNPVPGKEVLNLLSSYTRVQGIAYAALGEDR